MTKIEENRISNHQITETVEKATPSSLDERVQKAAVDPWRMLQNLVTKASR